MGAIPPSKPAGSYILALALIAVFAIVSSILVANELRHQASDVRTVNRAAGQPGLTYELAEYVDAIQRGEDVDANRQRLSVANDQFVAIHLGLQFGDPDLGLSGGGSGEVNRLYSLADAPFNRILAITQVALESTPTIVQTDSLRDSAAAFRSRMDSIVFQYQREAETRTTNLQRLEFILLSATLVLLFAEGMFLFRPAAKRSAHKWHETRRQHAAERERDRAEMEYLAQFDRLTGLPNRVLFRDRLTQALERARREGGWTTVMMVGMDNFQVVNDQYGHDIGDSLLREAATRIEETLRASDTVARLGADEFAVTLENVGDAEGFEQVAQKLNTALGAPYQLNGQEVFVTASIGITISPLDGETVDELLSNADLAMHEAKEAGRNTYQFFTSELRQRTSDRLSLLTSLRQALREKEGLELYFQPKVGATSGDIVGVEALIRWHHPDEGLVPPGRFIPVAEETDLIVILGSWVIEQACLQARLWERTGVGEFIISVNVSPRQFHHGDLVESVAGSLGRSGLAPEHLELELTEGALVRDLDSARDTLEELRARGVRVSIDDFGTGYSSLSYLKRLPIDVLKIDRSFVDDITVDPDDAAISEAIIRLGQTLRMEVVAEGVETREQLAFLRDLGCDAIQGFLISRPLPAHEFEAFLSGSGRQAMAG